MSSLPSTMPRSSTAASFLASTEAPLLEASVGFSGGRATTGRNLAADLAADLAAFFATTAFATILAARLGDDIKILAFLHGLVLLQLHLAVADALAGLHVVFHAVPRTDEVHLVFGEEQAHRGLVGAKPLLDLGDGQALAGRAALVQAEIAVGVEFAFVAEHADLVVADEHDPPVAILEFRKLCDEFFRHLPFTSTFHPDDPPLAGAAYDSNGLDRTQAPVRTHAINTDQSGARRAYAGAQP